MGPKQSMSSKKGRNSYFFGPNSVPKKVWAPKQVWVKKRNSYFWVSFCRYFLFCLKYMEKLILPVPFFVSTDIQFRQKKNTGKKVPKSMSSFFLGTHTFFGAHTFFSTMFGQKKSFFVGTHTFFWNPYVCLAQCSARQKL